MDAMSWIAVDWGTSNLRAWAIGPDGGVLAQASSDQGMARLAQADAFEPALLDLIGGWLPVGRTTLVVACGMVGARQGWIEAPYAAAPCKPVARFVSPAARDPRLDVRILAGIKQTEPFADVMRGEETQIAGVLGERPTFAGVVCLPGTHSKWARVGSGEVQRFQTFMTGELFELLSTRSVLRHGLDAAGWDQNAFLEAVAAAAAEPQALLGRLFSIRAESLVADLAPAAAKARLSGLLIGAELAAARSYWSDESVIIVGEGRQAGLYAEGLKALGRPAQRLDATAVTLAGLAAARTLIAAAPP